ncbi:MAG: hypothetical protein JSS61_06975 [Verrucomicrobia bacterium]|nr:hypothetical protein [Verrucomicrobiota bacterium]
MKSILIVLLSFLAIHSRASAGYWNLPAVPLSSSGVSAEDQTAAIDLQGNVIAAWVENGVVMTTSCPFGGSWNLPASSLSGSGASLPRLGVDSSGNIYAIWLENGVVKASSLPFGGSWDAPSTLSTSGATSPQIAVDADGNCVATWVISGTVQSATKLSAGSWPVTPVALSVAGASAPQVAIGNGTSYAVWIQTVSSIPTVYFSSATLGGSWSTAAPISTNGTLCNSPQLAADASGNVFANWFTYATDGTYYNNVSVEAARCPFGGSWDTPITISDPGLQNPALLDLSLFVDMYGNAVSLWTNSQLGNMIAVFGSVCTVGGHWTDSGQLMLYNPYTYASDVGMVPHGYAVAVWQEYDASTDTLSIQCSGSPSTGPNLRWTPPISISTGSRNTNPYVSCNGSNSCSCVAVWQSYDGANNIIQGLIGTGDAITPPLNPSGVQQTNNMQVFSELYNVVSWEPTLSPLASKYRIYRNGSLIYTTVDLTELQYIDDNRTAGVSDTYEISAYSQTGFESTKVSVTIP